MEDIFRLSSALATALLCTFHVHFKLGLVLSHILMLFCFTISSDLKPGRITLMCLKAIVNLTLSFWSSPMNVNY